MRDGLGRIGSDKDGAGGFPLPVQSKDRQSENSIAEVRIEMPCRQEIASQAEDCVHNRSQGLVLQSAGWEADSSLRA